MAFPALPLRVPAKLHSAAFATLRQLASAPPKQTAFLVRHLDFQQRRAFATMTMNGVEAEVQPQAKIQKLDESTNANVGAVALMLTSLRVKKLSHHAVLPSRGSALAAGYDLSSAYDTVVPARGKALVKTDLSVAVPEGTYGRIAPRSGLAWKNSIDVGAGVIDADYRGPLGVILFNHSDEEFHIKAGDRIAQFILERIVTPPVLEVDNLDATVRGEGGFGSTGVSVTVVA